MRINIEKILHCVLRINIEKILHCVLRIIIEKILHCVQNDCGYNRLCESQAAQLTYVQSTYCSGILRKSGKKNRTHFHYRRYAAKCSL